jgi:hypothetical protein
MAWSGFPFQAVLDRSHGESPSRAPGQPKNHRYSGLCCDDTKALSTGNKQKGPPRGGPFWNVADVRP